MVYESDAYEGDTSLGEHLRSMSPVLGIVAIAVALVFVLI